MSVDSPGSPAQQILLDSPPLSPIYLTPITLADESPPINHFCTSAPVHQPASSPSKRERKRRTKDRTRPDRPSRKRPRQVQESQPETSDRTSDPGKDLTSFDCISPSPASPFPSAAPPATIAIPDDYSLYSSLVLAGLLPFYQISPTIYVVQGWDRKTNEPTVSATSALCKPSDCSTGELASLTTETGGGTLGNGMFLPSQCYRPLRPPAFRSGPRRRVLPGRRFPSQW
jgi:hypothetical protein